MAGYGSDEDEEDAPEIMGMEGPNPADGQKEYDRRDGPGVLVPKRYHRGEGVGAARRRRVGLC